MSGFTVVYHDNFQLCHITIMDLCSDYDNYTIDITYCKSLLRLSVSVVFGRLVNISETRRGGN